MKIGASLAGTTRDAQNRRLVEAELSDPSKSPPAIWRSEAGLGWGAATTLAMFTIGADWLDALTPLRGGLVFAWLFATMIWLSFGVVRHADSLAVRLGEPYGTIILTLAVISIEVVMITAVMLTGGENPTLARDTMFSVLMIVLNGMLGLTLLLGGIRHHEQTFNIYGASAYLSVLVALAGLGLVLPRFTSSRPGGQASPQMEIFLVVSSLGLYLVFLSLQATRHRSYFEAPDGESDEHDHDGLVPRSVGFHAGLLVLTMLPIVLLSKKVALVADYGIHALDAPHALAGFFVAILVLSPEAMAACRAALQNRLQRTVNIALGSALATIGLTIPAVLLVALWTGKVIELGLDPAELVLLILTFLVAQANFGGTRTSVVDGAVHLILFAAYVMLLFD